MDFIDLKSQYRVLKREIDERIQRVLDHGQYILGPEIGELEQKLAADVGTRHCVTVASGTEALLIALMALGIKPGDEVVTTPFTFVATAEMIVLLGARAVLVDVEEDTANIAASMRAASMFAVSSSTSTNTGFAPSSTIISAVATNVNGVVITSSPGLISSAISAISSASVPEATVTQWRAPV